MALTSQVEESLREAQSNLRNALAFAARNESSYISKHISDMLVKIDCVIDIDTVLDKIEELDS